MRLYEKYIHPVADTFAYCLLKNHFHVSLKTKSEGDVLKTLKVFTVNQELAGQKNPANQGTSRARKPLGSDKLGPDYLSRQFSNFFNAYAKAINNACGRTGSLFQHPFGRVPITSDRQFWNVIAYIHQNPQKHRFVRDFRDWKWSSYGLLLSECPTTLKRDAVMDLFGGKQSYLDLHAQWVSDANARWFAEDDQD